MFTFWPFLTLIVLLISVEGWASDCLALRPSGTGFRVVHGVVDRQVEIVPGAPGRLRGRLGSRIVEIERLWGLGNKRILLEGTSSDFVSAVRVAFFLKGEAVRGVKIWSMDYLNPVSPFWLTRDDRNEWKVLDFDLPSPVVADSDFSFNFYARTIFWNPVSPVNLATGTRVDACVYFLLRTKVVGQ